ncbi:hypothetical protein BBP40_001355 [Aspergillus hancockii]|nr:hypothetical protein BBP40_001355 [Aspergillus hancockii]
MFPLRPDVRAWLVEKLNHMSEQQCDQLGSPALVKVLDTSTRDAHGQHPILGFALWILPDDGGRGDQTAVGISWPQTSDSTLCKRYFSVKEAKEKEFMGSRPHWSLSMLAVHPQYAGRNIENELLDWGLLQAKVEGKDTYVTARQEMAGFYQKRGFRILGSEQIAEGVVQTYLVRSGR